MLDLDRYKPFFGYAAGTTGGQGGPVVRCATGDAVQAALEAKGNAPLTIFITDTITGANSQAPQIDISGVRDLTIMGDGQHLDATNVGIRINKGSENIILFNLKIGRIEEGQKDAVGIEGDCKNIVLLHCDLYGDTGADKDYYDGLMDTKRGAERIAAVLCKFHDHHKACLNGASDRDEGSRRITFAYSWFDKLGSRCPSVRFGEAHVAGCLLTDVESSGVNCRMGAQVLIEGTTFERVHDPVAALDSREPGFWNLVDSQAIDCSWGKAKARERLATDWRSTTDFRPSYRMPMLPRAQAAAFVRANAGLLPPGKVITMPGTTATREAPPPADGEPAPAPRIRPAVGPASIPNSLGMLALGATFLAAMRVRRRIPARPRGR
jgi:pectate lyase